MHKCGAIPGVTHESFSGYENTRIASLKPLLPMTFMGLHRTSWPFYTLHSAPLIAQHNQLVLNLLQEVKELGWHH